MKIITPTISFLYSRGLRSYFQPLFLVAGNYKTCGIYGQSRLERAVTAQTWFFLNASLETISMCVTSFRRHKWLQKKKYTISDTVFGTVFHALSHRVIRHIQSVSHRHLVSEWWRFSKSQKLLFSWFSILTLWGKWIMPCEKACQRMVSNVAYIFVLCHFYVRKNV